MIAAEKSSQNRSLSDLETATFAVVEGMIYDEWILSRLPHARIVYFKTVFDCLSALKNGEVDAFPYDDATLRYLSASLLDSHRLISDDYVKDAGYGFAVNFSRRDLKIAIDETLAEIKSNGIYKEMINRWFPKEGAIGIMPRIKLSGKNGTLKFGTSTIERPFTFIVGDNITTGFDIELARRICSRLEMELEISNIAFSELIPMLVSGKVDMIGAAMVITEERSKKVLFSEPYFQGGMAILIKK